MKGRHRSGGLVAVLVCGLALAACGGGGGGNDVDALTGCLEDAGLKVQQIGGHKEQANTGPTDTITAGSPDARPADQVLIFVFSSSDDAEKYTSNLSGHPKQVGSVLIFSLDTKTKEYDQSASCAEEASG